MDVDVTDKPLYGNQEAALIGCNPKKQGRPSHAHHTYPTAGLRPMLGLEVAPGNENHANSTMPGLMEPIDHLPLEKPPDLVREDAGLAGYNR